MRTFAVIGLLLLSTSSAFAQPSTVEIDKTWEDCQATIAPDSQRHDDWLGWRRDSGGGYGDTLQFWDGGYTKTVSTLRETRFVDGIYSETHTFCFRPDGTLAFVLINGASPNMAQQPINYGTSIQRVGRIYLDPKGKVLRTTQAILDDKNKVLANAESETLELARGCDPIDLFLTTARVTAYMESEQGTLEERHPSYKPNKFDWCAVAKPQ